MFLYLCVFLPAVHLGRCVCSTGIWSPCREPLRGPRISVLFPYWFTCSLLIPLPCIAVAMFSHAIHHPEFSSRIACFLLRCDPGAGTWERWEGAELPQTLSCVFKIVCFVCSSQLHTPLFPEYIRNAAGCEMRASWSNVDYQMLNQLKGMFTLGLLSVFCIRGCIVYPRKVDMLLQELKLFSHQKN